MGTPLSDAAERGHPRSLHFSLVSLFVGVDLLSYTIKTFACMLRSVCKSVCVCGGGGGGARLFAALFVPLHLGLLSFFWLLLLPLLIDLIARRGKGALERSETFSPGERKDERRRGRGNVRAQR